MITFNCSSVAAATVIGLMVASVATTDLPDGLLVPRTQAPGVVSVPQGADAALQETRHLLGSPANAKRLLEARGGARETDVSPAELGEFWERFGLTDG